MSENEIQITAEMTPNPNTIKLNVNKILVPKDSFDFPNREVAKTSSLATQLFELSGIEGVFIGRDFITVTKQVAKKWQDLAPTLIEKLKAIIQSGEALVSEEAKPSSTDTSGESEVVKRICAILDAEIRPAVARDGGDIIFHGYKDGVVSLHLQGACSSCPSSIMTLKMGVENHLKQAIPEIKEVIQT